MNPVSLAPHLQRALEASSKDMGVDQRALVNQAVFAWLRTNGYTATNSLPLPSGESRGEGANPAPPPEPIRSSPTPAPVAPPPPPPVNIISPPVAPATPAADIAPLLQRMAEIDADLEKLTKPWPAWTPAPA